MDDLCEINLQTCLPAVEELIALGADVDVTISQQRMQRWTAQDAPCKLSQRGGESFWMFKMHNLCLLQMSPEAARGSLLGLIHLAVRFRSVSGSKNFSTLGGIGNTDDITQAQWVHSSALDIVGQL